MKRRISLSRIIFIVAVFLLLVLIFDNFTSGSLRQYREKQNIHRNRDEMMIRIIGPYSTDGFFVLVFSNSDIVSVRTLVFFWAYFCQIDYIVLSTDYKSVFLVYVKHKFKESEEICLEVKNRNHNWDEIGAYSYKQYLKAEYDWNSVLNTSKEKKISKKDLDELYPNCVDEFITWNLKYSP